MMAAGNMSFVMPRLAFPGLTLPANANNPAAVTAAAALPAFSGFANLLAAANTMPTFANNPLAFFQPVTRAACNATTLANS
jgi:hypothetical protein